MRQLQCPVCFKRGHTAAQCVYARRAASASAPAQLQQTNPDPVAEAVLRATRAAEAAQAAAILAQQLHNEAALVAWRQQSWAQLGYQPPPPPPPPPPQQQQQQQQLQQQQQQQQQLQQQQLQQHLHQQQQLQHLQQQQQLQQHQQQQLQQHQQQQPQQHQQQQPQQHQQQQLQQHQQQQQQQQLQQQQEQGQQQNHQNDDIPLNQCTIEEVKISIWEIPIDYSLGHCVAQDMRMSAGIAIYFKRNFKRVGQLMDQRPNVGSVAYLQHKDRFIYYLITKEFSNGKPSYNSITAAITKLRDLIVQHNVKKLAIPRIGCGLDQLDWSTVRGIIENVFQNVGCTIKICHFTHNLSKESELLRVKHPRTKKVYKSIKDIKQGKFEKLNIILFSRKTTLPVYWDEHFQSVNEKYCFKSQYYKDYEADLEVGQCLYYSTIEAHIFVIITNKNTTDHFSYQNLEKGLVQIKMFKNDERQPTFIIHRMYNHIFEDLINEKIVSLICSAFLDLTPCLILQLVSSNF